MALATCLLDTLRFKKDTGKMSKGKAAQEKRLKVFKKRKIHNVMVCNHGVIGWQADDQRQADEKYVAV